jgi:monoamine oxidase
MVRVGDARVGRREFLRGAGVLALGGLAASGSASAATSGADPDVIVVGAGLSGLCAARQLVAHGVSCVVLEASNRVGGRMVRRSVIEGGWIDLGGQWVGPTQTALLALARSLRISHFDSYTAGENVLYFAGKRSTYTGSGDFSPGSNVTIADLIAAQALSAELERLADTVNIAKPWLTPDAAYLDRLTVAAWLDLNSSWAFAKFAVTAVIVANGDDPGEISMLYLLYENATSPQPEEPEKWLFHGAAGQIPPILAAKLGNRVVLNQPVYAISQNRSGVHVTTPSGRYQGKFVIVATPPYLAGAIDYQPAMPATRLQLTQRFPMDSIIKNACIYPTAWWRKEGLSGSAAGQLAIGLTADSSPPSGRPGILTSFFVPPRSIAVQSNSAGQRRGMTIANLKTYFGPKVANPTQYIEANWPADKWSGGAYNGFMGPGVLTNFGSALRAPVGRIYWAGTEVATRWTGFFDGAVRAGQDAATSVIARL